MINKMKNQKGITLVALVITVIIMIILAGVTFNVLLGDGGLINRAKQAAEKYEEEAIRENVKLAVIAAKADAISNNNGEITEPILKSALDEHIGEGEYDITANSGTDGWTVTVGDLVFIITPEGTITETTTSGDDDNNDTPGTLPTPAHEPVANLENSTDIGTDTSENYPWDSSKATTGAAKLDLGETINVRLKKVAALAINPSADVTGFTVGTEDNYIKAFVWSNNPPTDAQKVAYGQLAMTSSSVISSVSDSYSSRRIVSDVPIYAWFVKDEGEGVTTGTIYLYSTNSDHELQLHPHSERMFYNMKNLETIAGFADHWKISNTDNEKLATVRYMFANTKVTNYNSIGWNVSGWTTTLSYLSSPDNNVFYKMCFETPVGTPEATKPSHPVFGTYQNGELQTANAGYWDAEGTFHSGETEPPQIPDGLQVGDYVSCAPTGTYALHKYYLGLSNDPDETDNLSATSNAFKMEVWRVYDIDESTRKSYTNKQ